MDGNSLTVAQLISQLGFSVVFLWLYLRERGRAKELSELRVADCKAYADEMKRLVARPLPEFTAQSESTLPLGG